ncbi:Thaumatin family protein [Dioscorea alata]|uniref:Thaumatin family protein n=1 Tax=Dioscorea alata TaxID=55571 RepID=A0ACB7V605_DIOAL|nr:Thaumatin family protein [Dioscorea alata]
MMAYLLPTLTLLLLLSLLQSLTESTTFTFTNKCANTVWPGALSNSGSAPLETTGFELTPGSSRAIQAPTGWSGRFFARTGCTFDSTNHGSCATADCGSNQIECNGAGAAPPATLAEFTLAGPSSSKDFYDVSLVDGYNVAMLVEPSDGCSATGCAVDLNRRCPAELRVGQGEAQACRSACEAFGTPEYCCKGEYANPSTCRPSVYSEMFKSACPRSYSYAFDDPTSTFTCSSPADYTITFCPDSTPSQKSTKDATTTTAASEPKTKGVVLEGEGGGESWLASLAIGSGAPSITRGFWIYQVSLTAASLVLVLFCFFL